MIRTGKGEPIAQWVRIVGRCWPMGVGLGIGWSACQSPVRGICLLAVWFAFLAVDTLLYTRSRFPDRRDLVGVWTGSGYVAWYVAGKEGDV